MVNLTTFPRKQQIEQVATKLFREKGYSAASMRDLAAETGIEAASLYAHFKSKEAILQNIIFRMADEFFKALESAEKSNERKDVVSKLYKIILAHLQVITEDLDASAVFFNEWRHLSDLKLQEFLKLRDNYENRIKAVLEEGVQKGEFRKMDCKIAVLTILSSLNWVHTWYKPQGERSAEDIAKEMGDLLILGLVK